MLEVREDSEEMRRSRALGEGPQGASVAELLCLVAASWCPFATATTVSFFSLFDLDPDVVLSGGQYDYTHSLAASGYNASTDTISSANLSLFFHDNSLGTDDSVSVESAGTPLGSVSDLPGFELKDFSGTLAVASSLLQVDGSLPVSLFLGQTIFKHSILEVVANRGSVTPPPPSKTMLTRTQSYDPTDLFDLGGGPLSFLLDVRPEGFDPAIDTIVSAVLTLRFEESAISGVDDSVSVVFDTLFFGGIVHDSASDGPFYGALGVAPWYLDDGVLGVSLALGSALFDSASLEVNFLRPESVPEPGTLALLGLGLAGLGQSRRRGTN